MRSVCALQPRVYSIGLLSGQTHLDCLPLALETQRRGYIIYRSQSDASSCLDISYSALIHPILTITKWMLSREEAILQDIKSHITNQ